MKNFTNNFKQFTSRLSARWLIMALMLLVGTSSAWAATISSDGTARLYFNMSSINWWISGNGNNNFAYFFNNSTGKNSWSAHSVKHDGNTYYVTIPKGDWAGVILTRNNTTTAPSWNNKWNQTGDITLSSTSNYISKFSEGSASVTWGTAVKPASTASVTAASTSIKVGESTALSAALTSNADINTLKSATYATTDGASVSDNTFTATTPGTYTVTATVTYHPNAYTDLTSTATATTTITVEDPCTLPSEISISGAATPCAESTQTYTATITGGADYDLVWTFPEGCTKTNETNNSITLTIGNASGNIICTAKCSESSTKASDPLAITVKTAPAVPTLSADKTSLVSPDKATLTAGNTTNGLTYTLYNGETPGESQTSTGGSLTFKVGEAGNYTVRVSNSCGTSTSDVVTITVCTPQTNEFRHANSSYTQLQYQPTYYPGDKAYFVSTIDCCLTGTWSNNLQKGEEGWWTGLTGKTPKFSMTLTRAGNFTITNMATNGCTQDKNVLVNLDFTITALSEVTNANGTASGADIALTWKHSANHTKVMVVRYPTAGTETIPAGGQSYSAGNTLGEGTVVYVGTSESYTDESLPAGVSYKYYFYTVNNNYYSDGVVLNMSSCPIPATPSLSSTAVTACNGECTAQGYIIIGNMGDYKDDTYTFKLGNSEVTPDANGKLGINSTAFTQYTVTVTNSCGNSNSTTVDIAINDNTPTISGPTSTLPGKSNAIELTAPTGSDTKWTVNNNGDLSAATGASTMFSAEDEREYTVTANYNGCTDTHIITVANGYTVYLRRPHAKNETTQYNYWFEKSNAAGPGYIKFGTVKASPNASELYTYNGGTGAETAGDLGTKGTESFTDCDGYVWDAYNIGIDVTALYFHAPNNKSTNGSTYGGHATYTRSYSQNTPISNDLYFTMGNWSNGTMGRTLTKVEKPFEGIEIEALGDREICSNNMASFAALYLKSNCTGQEITAYAWKYSDDNSNWGPYTTGKGATSNNIRPNVAGHYRLECELEDGKVVSNSIEITTKTCTISNADLNNITSNLPIIMVNTGDKAFPSVDNGKHCSASADDLKKKRSVDVKILWNKNGTVTSTDAYSNGATLYYDRKARMNYRGSSSLNFEKKSFAFCPGDEMCGDDEKGVDYVKTKKMNMFDIGEAEDKDWVLYAAYVDPSMMRNILAMETYSAMTGKWGVKNKYVELYIDGEYQGVYVFMDKVTQNKKRVDVKWDVKDDTKREFILKFDKTDAADRYAISSGDQKTFESDMTGKTGISTYDTEVDQRFEIEYPEKEDIEDDGGYWSDVYSFVLGKVNEFESALSKGDFTTVRNLINYESWADFFILNEFTKNVDAYRASCIFVYTGGKFEAWPLWDYELSFNNTVTGSGKGRGDINGLLIEHSDVYSDEFPAPFWWTGKYNGSNMYSGLLKDPCFLQKIKERWALHTKEGGSLHPSTTTAKTAAYKKILDEKGAATREFKKWPVTSRGKDACSEKSTGYYNYGGGGATDYANSYKQLNEWLAGDADTDPRIIGLQKEIDKFDDIIKFGISSTIDKEATTPWRAVNVTVDAVGADFTYTITPEITKGQVIEGSGNLLIYAELPQTYTVVTTLDAKDQCGANPEDNASSKVTFTVNDLVDNCEE